MIKAIQDSRVIRRHTVTSLSCVSEEEQRSTTSISNLYAGDWSRDPDLGTLGTSRDRIDTRVRLAPPGCNVDCTQLPAYGEP
jgi:hypothetical protein